MRPVGVVTCSVAAALAAACAGQPKVIPPHDPAPGETIRMKFITGRVLGAEATHPECPVRPHYEATLTVVKLSGKLQYRWERSTGAVGPLEQLDIPAAAAASQADVTLKPDEWADTTRGVQLVVRDDVHVISPIDVKISGADAYAKCY